MSPAAAFTLAAIYVLLAGILAYFLFRIIAPPDSSASAGNTGRRWCAWTVAAATVTMFPRVLHRAFDIDAIALWLLGTVVWGLVAFLTGWVWRSVSSRDANAKPGAGAMPTPNPSTVETPSGTMPSSKQSPEEINRGRDEDEIYERIAAELESGHVQKGLWTRLFAECGGDETRTKVAYIRERAVGIATAEAEERTVSARAPTTETTVAGSHIESALVNAPDPALVEAVWKGNWSTASALLAQGRQATGVDSEGRTLVDLATIRKDKPMLALLSRYITSK